MRSSLRIHERQYFFKYMSAATAIDVLERTRLRWSSPILFHDPFDVPRELTLGLEADEISRAFASRFKDIIEHPPEDTSYLETKLRLIIERVKKGVSSEFKLKILNDIEESKETFIPSGTGVKGLNDLWKSWLPEYRILSLTESPAHSAMWCHYADLYSGVVLEFRCVDELDSAWLIAKQVTYSDHIPAIYSANG